MNAEPPTSSTVHGTTRPHPHTASGPPAPNAARQPPARGDVLLGALPGAVVVLDRDGLVSESNPCADELFGTRVAGRRWRDVVAEHFDSSAGAGPDARTRDGRLVSIATRSLGVEPGQILLLTDVTETREIERRLRGLERLSEMGRMMAKLAHQLRTPLAAALLDASTLRSSEPTSSPRRAMQERVVQRLRDLEQLIDELLSFARQGRLVVTPLDLRELVDTLRARLAPAVEAGGATLSAELATDGEPWIEGNGTALASALESLVSNAVQVGATRVAVNVRAAAGTGATIRVIDNGPGVPAADAARIFDPFVTTRADGNGLGLAVARAVAEAHDGDLVLEATSSGGSVFRLDVPARAQEACA